MVPDYFFPKSSGGNWRRSSSMKPRHLILIVTFCLGIALGVQVAGPDLAYANPKAGELEQKIADINLLLQQLQDREAQVKSIRDGLGAQQKALNSEIQIVLKSLGIKNVAQAQLHLRLHYTLELLRTVYTYMDALDAKLLAYQTGRDRLAYLRQLAEDDIRMIATLNDLKIDALTTQISLVINRYLPEAHTVQIDPQHLPLATINQVWERITTGG
ncbi:MAG: hypothetical protein IH586_05810 [Anaerolineaceae bacterium]|nr:hypothetical protein [Anaerolineaceae bacterium]